PAFQINCGVDVVGNAPRVLNVFAIHVHHVQRAVGRVDEVHGAEPVVGRGDHLGLAVHARSREGRAVGRDLQAVEQVACALTDEEVAAIVLRVGRAAVTRDAARRSDADRADEFAAGQYAV